MLRSMPKHETEPYELWLAKPPTRPRHVQRRIVFRGEWTPEFGDTAFSVYVRRGLAEEGDFSCGISYLGSLQESLMLARYCGWAHKHEEIVGYPHIHWLTGRALVAGAPVGLDAAVTNRFDNLKDAVLCLVKDFNLSEIRIPDHIERMFHGTRH